MTTKDKIAVLKLAIKVSYQEDSYGMCNVIHTAEERLGFELPALVPYRPLRSYGITKKKYLYKKIATKRGAFWYPIGEYWEVRRGHMRAAIKELQSK